MKSSTIADCPPEFLLSAQQIEEFLTQGYIVIKNGIEPVVRQQWYDNGLARILAAKQNVDKDIIELAHTQALWMKDFAPKIYYSAAQLLGGEERVKPPEIWDDFIFNTKLVSEDSWVSPENKTSGWHIDGDYFKRFLDSSEQGLLCLILWSGVEHKTGGTFFALDSIEKVAKKLLNCTDGLYPEDFYALYKECKSFVEITGDSGDVVLAHPFMLHCGSDKIEESYRLITNPLIALNTPMNFNRADNFGYSPVELAILNALGVPRLAYARTSASETFRAMKKDRITEGF